jgi:hypothetical protein
MKMRALGVIAMCVLAVGIGITRKGAVLREPGTQGQAVAAAEKSRQTDRAPHIDSGGKELRVEKDKPG